MKLYSALLSGGLLALSAGGTASAATLVIEISGTCSLDCGNVGLSDGDGFGGAIEIDDSSFSPDGQSGAEALKSFSFSAASPRMRAECSTFAITTGRIVFSSKCPCAPAAATMESSPITCRPS